MTPSRSEATNGSYDDGVNGEIVAERSETQKISTLREITNRIMTKCQTQFNSSSPTEVRELFRGQHKIEDFLDYIAAQRLRRMPHPGSNWDKVLQWSEFFGTQVWLYHEVLKDFVSYSEEAASLVLRNCVVLLEMGPDYIDILEKSFAVFYSIGQTLLSFFRNRELFVFKDCIQHTLVAASADLVQLVSSLATYYSSRRAITSSTEFDTLFGSTVDAFFEHRNTALNIMWSCQLKQSIDSGEITINVQDIRQFLAPSDRVVDILMSNRMGSRSGREEFTCEWFRPFLIDFARSRDKMFLINGRSGTGKTVLGSWIIETLQRAQGKKSYQVLSHTIDPSLKTEVSQSGVVKSLLLQLLEHKIGDTGFYKQICIAYELMMQGKSADLELAMWKALSIGLRNTSNLMLVIDGLDHVSGGEEASVRLLDRLHEVTAGSSAAKCIVLSQPLKKPGSHHARLFTIEASHTREDLRSFVMRAVRSSTKLRGLSEQDKEKIVNNLTSSADGSFAWAIVMLEVLKKENTLPAVMKALDTAPKSIAEAVQVLLSHLDLKNRDTRSMLAWLLASERPLTLAEIKVLLELNISDCIHSPRLTDVEDDVGRAVGPLVDIRDGIVRFRNQSVRQELLKLANSVKDFSNKDAKFPFMFKEAHYDFVARCLAYVKVLVDQPIALADKPLQHDRKADLFRKYTLLEYAVRYWTTHFQNSPMYDPSGKHNITNEFKGCFTSSTLLAIMEYSCWEVQTNMIDAIERHRLALSLRKTIVGERSECVLQSHVAIARLCLKVSRLDEAGQYFYQAYRISQHVLGRTNPIITICVTGYLDSTASFAVKSRDELFTRKEEMLQYIISHMKQTRGASHELSIKYSKTLARLYREVNELERATDIVREVYEMCVEHYGRFHAETRSCFKLLVELYQQTSREDEIIKIQIDTYWSARRSLSITDDTLIDYAASMIDYYETRQEITKAEEILRVEEACNILIGTWSDFEYVLSESTSSSHQTTEIIRSVRITGEQLREVGVLTTANKIFQSLWSYYKRTDRISLSEASSVAVSLAETTRQITETYQTSSSQTSEEEERILREVFESTVSTTTTTTTTTTSTSTSTSTSTTVSKAEAVARSSMVGTALTLSSFYVRQERWSEATQICSKTLETIWTFTTTEQGTVTLPVNHRSEAIELAKRIAMCQFRMRRVAEAERYYRLVFNATKATLSVVDDLVIAAFHELVDFYDNTYQFDKVISIYIEFYTELKSQIGATAEQTIRIAYRLAEFCMQQEIVKEAEKYYYEVFIAFGKDPESIHQDAIEATLALCSIHEYAKHWNDARHFYSLLWMTFTKHTKDYTWTSETVDRIYSRYFYILEKELKAECSVLLQITEEFRSSCVTVFGSLHELTIKATFELAKVYERSEQHREKAVSLYEETFKKTSESSSFTSTTIQRTITEAKQRLTALYATKSSTSSKAISMYVEEYKATTSAHGYASRTSIEQLSELVTFYSKQDSQELHMKAVETLNTSVTQIVRTEKDSTRLFESATTIARLYLQINQRETAYGLLQEMRRQVVTEDYKSYSKHDISIEGTDRRSFVFIVAFEQALKGSTSESSFSEIMAALMTETLLYQTYTQSIRKKSGFEVTLSQGCRLLIFLQRQQRTEEHQRIDKELFEIFAQALHSQTSSKTLRELFNICVHEMGSNNHDAAVIENATHAVRVHADASRFDSALALASFLSRFIRLHGGFASQQTVDAGFRLCLYLTGRGCKRCADQKLHQQMLELSTAILAEVLGAALRMKVKFIQMPIKELNELVGLLGEQRSYSALEMILTDLWSSRHSQTSWSSTTIVWIGRRLVEVRFASGRHDAALHLCEDVCYNLKRVWGAFDNTTLEMHRLLAELYTAAGAYRKAMAIHEDILRQTLVAIDEDGVLAPEGGAKIASTHMDLLKRAYLRNGGWDKDPASYRELYGQLKGAYAAEQAWAANSTAAQGIEKWSTKDKKDGLGMWQQPASFEFASTRDNKHENNLRRTSGLSWAEGSGGRNGSGSLAGKQIKDRERQKGVNGGATQATVEWSGEIIE
ncbi:hypothetical protein H2201_005025 [Coniosporium apollinis]|uniref:Nephrocystin 3-like N-terminal domain-containing protein n=1 Tax=Coniosporium apollinis TaxID=61459 RepID=A0ABQ9NU70_9PEZI|nr:hypothetical protein H2201_005025 [Coniosporium apollinis]